jgi:hypothetical protein
VVIGPFCLLAHYGLTRDEIAIIEDSLQEHPAAKLPMTWRLTQT